LQVLTATKTENNMNTPKEVANYISRFVNTLSLESNSEKFIAEMNREHKTLQQSFTKFCLLWIENCASDEYRTDGRNEAAQNISKEVIETFKANNHDFVPSSFLPLI